MLTITLSDHAADQLKKREEARQADFDAQGRMRSDAEAVRAAKRNVYRDKAKFSLESGNFPLAAFRAVQSLWPYGKLPPPPVMESAGQVDKRWQAGNNGESAVIRHLEVQLDQRWTGLRGYKGEGGEIDLILVGPTGVFAIEVKFINGAVHCSVSGWYRDKYDRYGNLVKSHASINDASGYSPSQQLNRASNALQRALDKEFGRGTVRRIVVLAHEGSTIAFNEDSTVDEIVVLKDWDASKSVSGEVVITEMRAREIVTAVQDNHAFQSKHDAVRSANSSKNQGI